MFILTTGIKQKLFMLRFFFLKVILITGSYHFSTFAVYLDERIKSMQNEVSYPITKQT